MGIAAYFRLETIQRILEASVLHRVTLFTYNAALYSARSRFVRNEKQPTRQNNFTRVLRFLTSLSQHLVRQIVNISNRTWIIEANARKTFFEFRNTYYLASRFCVCVRARVCILRPQKIQTSVFQESLTRGRPQPWKSNRDLSAVQDKFWCATKADAALSLILFSGRSQRLERLKLERSIFRNFEY